MAYTPNTWQDRTGTGLNKFTDQNGNEYEFTPTPDEITQQGTPFSAAWMNHIEQGIKDNSDNFPVSITNGGTGATIAATARENLGVAGALISPVKNDFYTLTPPDGSFVTSLRAPFRGLLPYNSGGNGSLGDNDNPWLMGFINFLTSQTITCPNIVGTNIYGSSLGWIVLWNGNVGSGSIILPNARKYAAIIIMGKPAANESRVSTCLPGGGISNLQITSNLAYMALQITNSGTSDLSLDISENPDNGEINYVWGIVKVQA